MIEKIIKEFNNIVRSASECYKYKKPYLLTRLFKEEIRRRLTLPQKTAVPSAQWGLTTLFGMGRGVAPTR